MELIIGETISPDEFKSIELGEIDREKNFQELCLSKLKKLFENQENISDFDYKMGLLTNLIGSEKLKIKCAFKERKNVKPLQHSKIAIFEGIDDEKVVWSSTGNLSRSALFEHLEDIAIYKSFRIQSGFDDHGPDRIKFFEKIWSSHEFEGFIIDNVPSQFYREWQNKYPYRKKETEDETEIQGYGEAVKRRINDFKIPGYINNDDPNWAHQGEAVNAWVDNNYRGILAMATGSGKTITAMIAAKKLHENINNDPLLIVVSAPYNVLVNQWVDEIAEFGLLALNIPALPAKNKIEEIKKELLLLAHKKINISVVVTSIDYLKNEKFQKLLEQHQGIRKLLIGDEVHNLGQKGFSEKPPSFFDFRLGLSATPESKFNEKRDKFLIDYFGDIVFRFDLEDAIGKCLVEYNYHLHKVFLTEEEMGEWVDLTKNIEKLTSYKDIDDPIVTRKLQERSRILSSAMNKINVLDTILKNIDSSTISKTIMYFSEQNPEQINQANELLSNQDIKYHQITHNESPKERDKIIEYFKNDYYKVLTAKRILDEGVNIPSIEVAYIVSSNSQPRQWTQRRGRVLRKCPGKDEAFIHDFIVLPSATAPIKYQKKLIEKELERIDEFAKLSKNQYKEDGAAYEVAEIYNNYLINN